MTYYRDRCTDVSGDSEQKIDQGAGNGAIGCG